MSSSDSPLSEAAVQSIPADKEIARALRDVVRQAHKNNELDSLSLKGVRTIVANQLDLPVEFLRTDAKWKSGSKAIVTQEVDKLAENTGDTPSSPVEEARKPSKATRPTQKKKAAEQKTEVPLPKLQKRKPADAVKAPTAKRRRKTVSDSDDEDDPTGDSVELARSSAERPSQSPVKTTSKKESNIIPVSTNDLGPESDLSDVLDEGPSVLKSKRKKEKDAISSTKQSAKAKARPVATATAKAKPKPDTTPQEEEIKRLQTQLGKCGIRKVWGVALSKFDDPRDKIAHLKSMLSDVGMDGRFSEDKARQIKETRELRADLEAIQEGEEMWGMKEDVPRKRLARGLAELQGIGDDEESD